MYVAKRIDGSHGVALTRRLLLMQLNFVGLQTAVTLLDIHVAGEDGIVGVIALGVIGVNGHRQAIGVTLYLRTGIARYPQHTLRCEVGRSASLTVKGTGDHGGQEGGNTFFHTLYLLFRHLWLRGMQTVRD